MCIGIVLLSQSSPQLFRSLAEAEVDRCRTRALDALENALALELERPYTQNLDYSRLRKQWLHRFRTVHLPRSSSDEDGTSLGSLARSPVGTLSGLHNIANLLDFMDDVLGFHDAPEAVRDSQEEELMVMAEVRAYFHVAYKVCHRIHSCERPAFKCKGFVEIH